MTDSLYQAEQKEVDLDKAGMATFRLGGFV
jgi:hypothetical protein